MKFDPYTLSSRIKLVKKKVLFTFSTQKIQFFWNYMNSLVLIKYMRRLDINHRRFWRPYTGVANQFHSPYQPIIPPILSPKHCCPCLLCLHNVCNQILHSDFRRNTDNKQTYKTTYSIMIVKVLQLWQKLLIWIHHI